MRPTRNEQHGEEDPVANGSSRENWLLNKEKDAGTERRRNKFPQMA